MTVLRMHGVGVAWSACSPVLEDVTLVLEREVYGLVGANGAGKTTLLTILAGELTPHDGSVALHPKGAVVAHCPQRVDALTPDVEVLALRDDGLAAELRGRLALEPEELMRWSTLSPGERKRWQIAAALAREPEVLLLDEPTNHLDVDARTRLLGALKRFRGLGVIVSHDRAVLDSLTRATLRIHERKVSLYAGRYSDARGAWERERANEVEAHHAARERVRRAEAQLDVARRTREAAASSISTRARMKDKNDSDARAMSATTLALWAEDRAGRTVGVVRGAVERAREAVPTITRDRTLGSSVFAAYQPAPNPVLAHVDAPELKRGEHVVLRDVRLTLAREDRVRIEGANGAGKTTLLEALVSSVGRPERVLYLPQELEPDVLARASENLATSDREQRSRVLAIFAALGSDPERILRGDRPGERARYSPGEARKLVLAQALAHQVWALVLDEPTNHMDLPSIERLEAALVAYPGSVLLVTHDDAFAARVTTRSLEVRGGTVS